MIKIHLVSDLHTEFGVWPEIPVCGDILAVAGDLCTWSNVHGGVDWLNEQGKKFDRVFFIPGNHEYYGGSWYHVNNYWTNKCRFDLAENVICLMEKPAYEYKDTVFIGHTLWTDLKNGDPLAKLMFMNHMRDYTACIGLTPEETIIMNRGAKQIIEQLVLKNIDKKVVILTHHIPTDKAIHPKWAGDHLNAAFANYDGWAEKLLLYGNIKLWHFGHTHTPFYRNLGDNTPFVCNPHGYAGYENNGFEPRLVLEV